MVQHVLVDLALEDCLGPWKDGERLRLDNDDKLVAPLQAQLLLHHCADIAVDRGQVKHFSFWPLLWEGLRKSECDHPKGAPRHVVMANESCHEARRVVGLSPRKDARLDVRGVVPVDSSLAQVECQEAHTRLSIANEVMPHIEGSISRLCGT